MRMKSLHLFASIVLAGAALHAQAYWSTTPLDCTGVGGPIDVLDSTGQIAGFTCFVSGTFIWYAAGGAWTTELRVNAPESAPIGVDYKFFDGNGGKISLDAAYAGTSSTTSGNEVQFALNTNQGSEVDLLGATNTAPSYGPIADGTVYATFFCADAGTCSNVLPQLLYSALPTVPWYISVPITWDNAPQSTLWSAEGIDDGSAHKVSFVIYNQSRVSNNFTIRVYDSTGTLAGSGLTRSIPPMPPIGNGFLGEGGVYADLVSNVIHTTLPPGVFKMVFDGGASVSSAVEVLQFNGATASSVQVAFDNPNTATTAPDRTPGVWNTRVSASTVTEFPPLP